jgi:hypothetical protein
VNCRTGAHAKANREAQRLEREAATPPPETEAQRIERLRRAMDIYAGMHDIKQALLGLLTPKKRTASGKLSSKARTVQH